MPRVAAAFVTRSSYMVLVSFPVAVGKYSNMDILFRLTAPVCSPGGMEITPGA